MKYMIVALLITFAGSAQADGISCPEMAKMITDYENEKKSGRANSVRLDTINGVLSATKKSYSASCKNSKNNQG